MMHRFLPVLASTFFAFAPSKTQHVTIYAVGDMHFDRSVRAQIKRYGNPYPFQNSRSVLDSADATFGNLETPLTTAPKIGIGVKFRSEPNNALSLRHAGFDVLSVANNHALDCGETGLRDTWRQLENAGLAAIGTKNPNGACFQNLRNVRVAWLGFSEFAPQIAPASTFKVQLLNDRNLQREIAAAKRRADVVIVSCHWGVEYQIRPTMQQKRWAKIAAQSGADVVLGHHPHVWQGVQVLVNHNKARKTLVAYSLGNWVFDVKSGWTPRARETAILQLTVGKNGVQSAKIVPFIIEKSRPHPANSSEKFRFWKSLQVLAGELGTVVRDGRIEL